MLYKILILKQWNFISNNKKIQFEFMQIYFMIYRIQIFDKIKFISLIDIYKILFKHSL